MVLVQDIKELFHQYQVMTPAYVAEEQLLRRNLEKIKSVADATNVEIILAFKAFAVWRLFPILREYIQGCTSSSLGEARLGLEQFGTRTHTYAPVYKEQEFGAIMDCSHSITFNSLEQFNKYFPSVKAYSDYRITCGLRINPEYSEVSTDIYNPAAPGSRLGILASDLPYTLPKGVEGLHFHNHCESDSYSLERTLEVIEEKFGRYLGQVKWLNMGGGHLITHQDYDTRHLIRLLTEFGIKYPHLKIVLEPGSAFAWQTGYLATEVQDIVTNHGIKTLMIDASFTCHMPDCLEMPYQPAVRGAEKEEDARHRYAYRIGGNSCLSGDFMGNWYFEEEVQVGDLVIFEDMIHYTIVKTNTFNGIAHPSICLHHKSGELEVLRQFGYEDYKNRMS